MVGFVMDLCVGGGGGGGGGGGVALWNHGESFALVCVRDRQKYWIGAAVCYLLCLRVV